MRRFFILIGILLVPLIILSLYIFGVFKRPVKAPRPLTLTMWVVNDSPKAYRDIVTQYNQLRPYIRVNIEQVAADNYAQTLKDAWARGKGPDIFFLPSSWIGEFANDFLLPVLPSTKVYTYFSKKIFYRTDVEVKETVVPSITIPQLRSDFVDVVYEDVVRDNKIYGLPLTIDTLVLYYNRDLLRSENIVEPPRTWNDLAQIVPKLALADEDGKIIQSAIALGTGKNVTYAHDIISLLFLQDGVTMNAPGGNVPIDDSIADDGTNLGENALKYYMSFADPEKVSYSWNADQPSSREAFVRGKTAMFVGYGSDRGEIQASGSIDFGVAPIPHLQPEGKDALFSSGGIPLQVNYGNYWTLSVFQRTAHPNEAWNFVQFLTREGRVRPYLSATGKASALRAIIQEQQANPELKVFADQAASARSWYRGRNATAVEGYLRDMLDNAASKKMTPLEALSLARKQIELTTKVRQ